MLFEEESMFIPIWSPKFQIPYWISTCKISVNRNSSSSSKIKVHGIEVCGGIFSFGMVNAFAKTPLAVVQVTSLFWKFSTSSLLLWMSTVRSSCCRWFNAFRTKQHEISSVSSSLEWWNNCSILRRSCFAIVLSHAASNCSFCTIITSPSRFFSK